MGVSGTGFQVGDSGFLGLGFSRFRVLGTQFAVFWFSRYEVSGYLLRVFEVRGFGYGVWGMRFRVRCFGHGFSRFGVFELGVSASWLRGS